MLETILLTASLTETCISKSNGIFSAMIFRKVWRTSGRERELFWSRLFSRLQKAEGGGWGVPSRVSPDGENNAAKKNMNRSKSAKRHGTGGP